MYRYPKEATHCHVVEVTSEQEKPRKALCGKNIQGLPQGAEPEERMCNKCRRRMKKPQG